MDNDNPLLQKAADLYRGLRFTMKYRGVGILPAAAHPLNAHGVVLGGAAREGRPQLGIAGVYLARRGDGQHRPDILCRGGPAAIQAGGIVARHDAENVR